MEWWQYNFKITNTTLIFIYYYDDNVSTIFNKYAQRKPLSSRKIKTYLKLPKKIALNQDMAANTPQDEMEDSCGQDWCGIKCTIAIRCLGISRSKFSPKQQQSSELHLSFFPLILFFLPRYFRAEKNFIPDLYILSAKISSYPPCGSLRSNRINDKLLVWYVYTKNHRIS